MGNQQSSKALTVGVSDFNPHKYEGDWWFVGKTTHYPYDENSDEFKQSLKWNHKTNKMEIKRQGYKNGKHNEYTHSHGQFWRVSEECPAMMNSHYNGYPPYLRTCLLWTNYTDFAIWTNMTTGVAYLMSRERKLSGNNSCALSKILRQVCIEPSSMIINKASLDEDAPGTRLAEAVPLMYLPHM
jgi:hypothetical protein